MSFTNVENLWRLLPTDWSIEETFWEGNDADKEPMRLCFFLLTVKLALPDTFFFSPHETEQKFDRKMESHRLGLKER